MPRQLTPEEQKIIRQTEAEGMANSSSSTDNRPGAKTRDLITGILIFAAVFVLFAMIAYFVVSSTTR